MADNADDFTEHQVDSKAVYQGRLLTVLEDQVRTPHGKTARREVVQHPGAVAVVPLLDSETVVLVRQYRYAMRRHFYELPAGKLEPGENPLETARRELREECGFEAADWQPLTVLHPCIGYSNERIDLYLARDLTQVGSSPDDEEFLEQMTLRLPLALQWIKTGRITDVKTIIGLMWAERLAVGLW